MFLNGSISTSTIVKGIFICLFCTVILSCNNQQASGSINEGIIEYDAKVIDFNHPLAELAPGSATLRFKNDKLGMEMTAMGLFKNTYVCNLTDKTLTQIVNFLDLKQVSIENESDIMKENSSYKLLIEETPETKMIAGYKCKKMKIKKAEDTTVVFDAYYTSEIGNESINSLSPYSGIDGMLMQYRLRKMGLEMEFTAKSVKKINIPDDAFMIPQNFKKVSKEEMQQFFAQF